MTNQAHIQAFRDNVEILNDEEGVSYISEDWDKIELLLRDTLQKVREEAFKEGQMMPTYDKHRELVGHGFTNGKESERQRLLDLPSMQYEDDLLDPDLSPVRNSLRETIREEVTKE